MAGTGLNMKIIEEILRLKKLNFSERKIARSLGVHRKTIKNYLLEADKTILPKIESNNTLNDQWFDKVDWQKMRDEVQMGTTLLVLYNELFESNQVTVTYPAFWKMMQKKAPNLKTTMVKVFTPGSRIEIDYCDGISFLNVSSGEVIRTELFVGVLCSSRYTFAEFTLSQKSCDFLNSHVRMFNFFGGIAVEVTPDNLKSAVTKAHRYDPVINPAYSKLATHYNFAVSPARVRRPQDKAIVERTIQIFQRWFYMINRNRTFTSLIELNLCLQTHLIAFNGKMHRIFKKTRAEMFELEKPHLLKLPESPYLVQTHQQAMLSRDCHLMYDNSFYSAPFVLRGLRLDVWATENSIEIYNGTERVAFHGRSKNKGKFITDKKHYPSNHQIYADEDVLKLKSWAIKIGVETAALIEELLSDPHPLKNLRRAQAILALSTKYNFFSLEESIKTANLFNQKSIQYIKRVIEKNQTTLNRIEKGGEIKERSFNPHVRGIDDNVH